MNEKGSKIGRGSRTELLRTSIAWLWGHSNNICRSWTEMHTRVCCELIQEVKGVGFGMTQHSHPRWKDTPAGQVAEDTQLKPVIGKICSWTRIAWDPCCQSYVFGDSEKRSTNTSTDGKRKTAEGRNHVRSYYFFKSVISSNFRARDKKQLPKKW